MPKNTERPAELATIEEIRAMKARGVKLAVEYVKAETEDAGPQKYHCIYSDGKRRHKLVAFRVVNGNASPRLFSWTPGLWNHHAKDGDDTWLCYNPKTKDIICSAAPTPTQ